MRHKNLNTSKVYKIFGIGNFLIKWQQKLNAVEKLKKIHQEVVPVYVIRLATCSTAPWAVCLQGQPHCHYHTFISSRSTPNSAWQSTSPPTTFLSFQTKKEKQFDFGIKPARGVWADQFWELSERLLANPGAVWGALRQTQPRAGALEARDAKLAFEFGLSAALSLPDPPQPRKKGLCPGPPAGLRPLGGGVDRPDPPLHPLGAAPGPVPEAGGGLPRPLRPRCGGRKGRAAAGPRPHMTEGCRDGGRAARRHRRHRYGGERGVTRGSPHASARPAPGTPLLAASPPREARGSSGGLGAARPAETWGKKGPPCPPSPPLGPGFGLRGEPRGFVRCQRWRQGWGSPGDFGSSEGAWGRLGEGWPQPQEPPGAGVAAAKGAVWGGLRGESGKWPLNSVKLSKLWEENAPLKHSASGWRFPLIAACFVFFCLWEEKLVGVTGELIFTQGRVIWLLYIQDPV